MRGEDISGRILPIIERNTVIPARGCNAATAPTRSSDRSASRSTRRAAWVRDNIFIDSFDVALLATGEIQALDVRFSTTSTACWRST